MKRSIGAIALSLAFVQPALAGTAPGRLAVSATARANCMVRSPLGLDFGTYHPKAGASHPVDVAAAVISIQCTKGSPGVRIALDAGQGFAGGRRALENDRRERIEYELYTGPDRTQPWSGSQTVTYLATSGSSTPLTLYGRVFPPASPRPGTYSDTVLAMVNF